jgi:hypothetical protein
MRIISSNDFDSATLTSSPACVAAAPIGNLKLSPRAKVARISPVAAWSISGTWSPSRAVSAFSLYKHNLSGAATVRLRLYSDIAMTTQIYDSTAITIGTGIAWGTFGWGAVAWAGNGFESWPASYYTMWFSLVANVAAFRVDISDVGNADGFLEAGRIYMGTYWSPSTDFSYGFDMVWKEQSRQFRTDGGSLRTEGYTPYRSFTVDLNHLSSSDRTALSDMLRKIGMRGDIFVSFFPGLGGDQERDYTAAIKLTKPIPLKGTRFGNWETSGIEMEEI